MVFQGDGSDWCCGGSRHSAVVAHYSFLLLASCFRVTVLIGVVVGAATVLLMLTIVSSYWLSVSG